MKNARRNGTTLTLRKQTIRVLTQVDLGKVDGGDPASALCPTHRCTPATAVNE
jgi:hypothetical protein